MRGKSQTFSLGARSPVHKQKQRSHHPRLRKVVPGETPEDKLIELADTVLARWDGPEVPPEQSQMEDGPTELANPGTIEAASTEETPARAPTNLSDA